MSTTNHPETDNQIDCVNQVLEDMLQAYVTKKQTNWEDYLPILIIVLSMLLHALAFSCLYMAFNLGLQVTMSLANEKIQQVKDFLADRENLPSISCKFVQVVPASSLSTTA